MTIWTSLDGKQMLKASYKYGKATTTAYQFEAFDEKGRRIGVNHTVQEVDIVDGGEDCYGLWEIELGYGSFFHVSTHMTKNGRPFGASQPSHWFKTMDEVRTFLANDLTKRVKRLGAVVDGVAA